jgi:uncharacterized small protein (DUF1192 family)
VFVLVSIKGRLTWEGVKDNMDGLEEAAMAIFDEDERPKPAAHAIGEDLATLSEEELVERIAVLRGEIERIEEVLASKRASRDAASTFFKS